MRRAAMLAWLILCLARAAFAHEIPADVRLQVYVRPEGRELVMLARVPLAAMREVDVPTRGPGYLDLAQADGALREAASLWITDNLEVRAGDRDLGRGRVVDARVSLASDRSFESWDRAVAQLHAPRIDPAANLYWNQQLLDVMLAWPLDSPDARIAIHPRFEKLALRVSTALRFVPPGGPERAFELHGDPGWVVLDPGWTQAAWSFVKLGVGHILDGTDHLLFIACLVIPFRRLRSLVVIATAFTLAHSITLALAATGHAPDALWFPPLVELLIAVSILWLAIENVFGANAGRRWIVAFVFGLVHGFGFAFGLRESLQFAGEHLATALAAFNVGVEIGQLAVICVLVPVLEFLFRRVPERLGVIVLSALVGHTAWHWMVERWDVLAKFPMPTVDAAASASLMRWAMAAIVAGAAIWVVQGRLGPRLLQKDTLGPRRRGDDTGGSADPGAGVAEHAHPGRVVAPAVGMPGKRHGAEDPLGVRHEDGESAVGRGD